MSYRYTRKIRSWWHSREILDISETDFSSKIGENSSMCFRFLETMTSESPYCALWSRVIEARGLSLKKKHLLEVGHCLLDTCWKLVIKHCKLERDSRAVKYKIISDHYIPFKVFNVIRSKLHLRRQKIMSGVYFYTLISPCAARYKLFQMVWVKAWRKRSKCSLFGSINMRPNGKLWRHGL